MRHRSLVILSIVITAAACAAKVKGLQQAPLDTGIKYVRDSEEYATLARQVYRQATEAVARMHPATADRPWAVVLDIDETTLDNSTYQVERAALGLGYDDASWNAWVVRRAAPPVPGVMDFIAAARKAGGHIAWITNRSTVVAADTRENLQNVGLWRDDDRLCAQVNSARTKRIRRSEVMSGTGECAWPGKPVTVVAFIGDQLGDFPEADERVPNAGTDADFGRTCFLLPNSMYGAWTTKVTRVR